MASSKWITFSELIDINRDRPIVFWGASSWIEKTLSHESLNVSHVVDNSQFNQGITYDGYPVKSPSTLKSETERFYIVITTVNYMSVIDELHEMGFVMGTDFCCTPLLNHRAHKDDLLSLDMNVLIASPVHHQTESTGGGLYVLNVSTSQITKVATGKMRGIAQFKNEIYAVDMLRGIVVFNQSFEEQSVIPFEKNTEPHGICIDESSSQLFIAQPGRDSVAVYSLIDREYKAEIFISDKWLRNKKDNHHINDLCVHDGSLFVSMFSFSGNWSNECYDGGVIEIDLETREVIGPVISNLWMPHSVMRHNGKLLCLDSMRGDVVSMNHQKQGGFSGFARGLDVMKNYYVIGMSEHRYPEKLTDKVGHISLDSGVVIFDTASKLSKFYALNEAESIHSLMILN